MGEASGIDYAGASWGPWRGCTKVSPGCAHCYAERDMTRYGHDFATVTRAAPQTFNLPIKRDKAGEYKLTSGTVVFVCPWGDFLHPDADQWRPDAWAIIRERPDLVFVIVTKRPERINDVLPGWWYKIKSTRRVRPMVSDGRLFSPGTDRTVGPQNVVWMATVEDQDHVNRLRHLASAHVVSRAVSLEPLLGPVILGQWVHHLDWIVVGGESGWHGRVMEVPWVQRLYEQALAARVPYYFKQWGRWWPYLEVPRGPTDQSAQPGVQYADRANDRGPQVPLPAEYAIPYTRWVNGPAFTTREMPAFMCRSTP